jgi:hypothetical protein
MKKFTLLMLFVPMAYIGNATVYLDELFNSTGVLKNTSGWTSIGTMGTWTDDFVFGTTSLTYSNTGGTYVLSGQGKSVVTNYLGNYTTNASNYCVAKSFNATAISTGTVYLSFLYCPNSVSQSQSNSPAMSMSTSGSNTGVQVWIGKGAVSASNFRFGTTRGSTSSGDIKWTTTEYSDVSAVYLIVLKYDLGSQTASVFVNPTIGTTSEPTADISENTSTSGLKSSLQTLQFKVTGGSKAVNIISGVRISSAWSEAVAAQSTAAKLSAPTVGTASGAVTNGFTANWTPVANAVGYDVKVYLGTNLISTTNASGQTVSSLAVSGLMSGMTYTYKVVAKGDGTSYSDSDPSVASTSVTTSDPYAAGTIDTDFNDGSWGTVATVQPASGSYPSASINGFDLTAALVYNGSGKDNKGVAHTNRVAIDKNANGGSLTLPTVNSVAQFEIHATAGTAGNGFVLQEFIPSTNTWSNLTSTLTYDQASKNAGVDSVYIVPVSRSVPTKFRIANANSGGIYIFQVITRTTNPATLDQPQAGAASTVTSADFTANWTAVANATGYKVYVYQGSAQISGSPFSVGGQASQSYDVSGLQSATDYTYRIQAVGDNDVNYLNSYLSAPVAETTSVATGIDNNESNAGIKVEGKTIILPVNGKLEIYSLQGAALLSAYNVQSVSTNLGAGIYIVRFTAKGSNPVVRKIKINN